MSDYKPFDQDRWLGPPPWSKDDPKLLTWEHVHGHDARLDCYPEFGCQVIGDDAYDRGRRDEQERIVAKLRDKAADLDAPGVRQVADLIESEQSHG